VGREGGAQARSVGATLFEKRSMLLFAGVIPDLTLLWYEHDKRDLESDDPARAHSNSDTVANSMIRVQIFDGAASRSHTGSNLSCAPPCQPCSQGPRSCNG
jgi:hypothetical protein